MRSSSRLSLLLLAALVLAAPLALAAPRKPHVVGLGAARRVHYSKIGDPAGASPTEQELQIRPLVVDGTLKEWTTGEAHDITDRSFVVRRVLKINDGLPGEGPARGARQEWVWQRGPWLLVDRVTGHVAAVHLPDYDPGVSHPAWFRDYAAYCGVASTGKSLFAVVAQLSARKAVLHKKLGAFDPDSHPQPACTSAEWQRDPMRVTFRPSGRDPVSYDFLPGSAILVEDTPDDDDAKDAKEAKPK